MNDPSDLDRALRDIEILEAQIEQMNRLMAEMAASHQKQIDHIVGIFSNENSKANITEDFIFDTQDSDRTSE